MKLPRVSPNVQYEIRDDQFSRSTRVTIACSVGSETLYSSVAINDYGTLRGDAYAEHAVEAALRDLERSVGTYLVRGKKP